MSRARVDQHYQRALGYLEAADWPAAEGLLLQLRGWCGPEDLAVADALAYALLMQGDYGGCAQVLRPVLEHPQRSFWIQHKYADALRGLHDLQGAAAHYRLALQEGASSALPARNLLQVLHGLSPQLALAQLQSWTRPWPEAWLEGAQQAAELVAGLELAAWLEVHGLATPALQRRLAEQQLYGLQLPQGGVPEGADWGADGDAAWCLALQQRLRQLALR